jgi:hypothetical protein
MAFLVQADITDKVAIPFIASASTDIDTYLAKGDAYIVSLAQSKGVMDSANISTPLVIELKEYGLAKLYIDLFLDASYVNNLESFEADKYTQKRKDYEERAMAMAKLLTYEMITGSVEDKTDRSAFSFDLYRS